MSEQRLAAVGGSAVKNSDGFAILIGNRDNVTARVAGTVYFV
ncbi:MAG: hypothetical protein BMS9Abin30_1081 [Gammaproteobacteria bacterium]|nr:MAG: hypothetical protein BMS9Abin30_1081 [Gammaproteobacteria bacterium]